MSQHPENIDAISALFANERTVGLIELLTENEKCEPAKFAMSSKELESCQTCVHCAQALTEVLDVSISHEGMASVETLTPNLRHAFVEAIGLAMHRMEEILFGIEERQRVERSRED